MAKLKINKPQDEAGAAWPAICVGMFVAFGGVLFGYDTVRHQDQPQDSSY